MERKINDMRNLLIIALVFLAINTKAQKLEAGALFAPVYNLQQTKPQNFIPSLTFELVTDDFKLMYAFSNEYLKVGAFLGSGLEAGLFYKYYDNQHKIEVGIRYVVQLKHDIQIKAGGFMEVPVSIEGDYRLSPFTIQITKRIY